MVSAGSITVAVRVRPPSAWETARLPEPAYDVGMRGDGALSSPIKSADSFCGLREVVKIVDDRILMFDPDEKDRTRAFMERGFLPPGTKRYKDKRFMFDRVFDGDARQIDVYEATAKPLLTGFLDGYNATVFAYGATGCGKTHTITGTESEPGIIYLTMADLFQKIDDRRDDYNVEIGVTFLEIYNEEIRDLLAEPGYHIPRGGLQIREDKAVKVVGLVELHPNSAEEIKDIVLLGNTRRTQSPTHANETSSRSHAVLQIHVTQSPRTASTTEQRSMATLSIIDLAGSERAAATTNMGQRMVEGANINKSLLALGNCINALCESGGATRHVPYRNSKLTRLLKFSLGGNCKTVMIVCVAPTSNHFDDTHNTLLYADRATKIKTKVVTRNVVNVDRHVGQYVEAINRLNLEVAELKAKLAGKLHVDADVQARKRLEAKSEADRAKEDMQRKVEQTQPNLVDGAYCQSKIKVAEMKLEAIRSRLFQLQEQRTAAGHLPPNLAAEEFILQALAAPEESILKPHSRIQLQLQRSNNANNMFEAMLRAVTERRLDRLDEVSVDNVRLDARLKRVDMDRLRMEKEKEVFQESFLSQTKMFSSILGILASTTVMIEESSRVLKTALDKEKDALEGTIREISSSLRNLAESNNSILSTMAGGNVNKFAQDDCSALRSFTRHPTIMTPAIQVNSEALSSQNQSRPSRRFSSIGGSLISPSRRAHRNSPRKSLRSSMVHGGVPASGRRVVSDKAPEKKKTVQWKDEAGEGNLEDGGLTVELSSSSQRNLSIGGSESEWEDEKTDDSLSFAALPWRDLPIKKSGSKRPRASRLDPTFLKSRSPALGSLIEDDETKPDLPRPSPLSDRANRLPTPSGDISDFLHVSRGRSRAESPNRREPSTFRIPGSAMKSGRRRSNVGPMRSDKVRRRSSLLPRLSPSVGDGEATSKGGARRVAVNQSPVKRPKRTSLLASARISGTLRSSVLRVSVPVDPNGSGDISFKGSKPTWR